MSEGQLGIALGLISILISLIGWFDPVGRLTTWRARRSVRRAERRIAELEGELRLVRHWQEHPEWLVVWLFRMLLPAVGLLPIAIVNVTVVLTTPNPSALRTINGWVGIVAFATLTWYTVSASREAREFTRFTAYEAEVDATLAQLRARLPAPTGARRRRNTTATGPPRR